MSDNFENNKGFDPDGQQEEKTDVYSSEAEAQAAPSDTSSNAEESQPFSFESGEFFFNSPTYSTEENSASEEMAEPESADEPEQPASATAPSHFDAPINSNSSSSSRQPNQQNNADGILPQVQNYQQGNSGYYGYNRQQQSNAGGQPQQNPNAYYQFGRQQTPSPQYNFGAPNQNNGNKSSKGKTIAVVVIVAAIVIGLFTVVSSLFSGNSNNTGKPQVDTTVSTTAAPTAAASENAQGGSDQLQYSTTDSAGVSQLSAVEVGKKARKSVVGVMTYKNGQLSGEGSGVVMSIDSTNQYTYIITCAHVINESGVTYGVLTLEGKRYDAELVAADSRTDIGVLKVKATDLPVAEFGDSTTLEVGETVYAIGNPGGSEYFGSMTDGIVSAIDRSINNTYNMTCIQHNAAINPGNSGGALVNSAGQVVGINSSKIAATDYEGMGFAIPMSIAKPIVDNLIQYKYVPNRPKLGIEYASVSEYQLYSMVVAIRGLPSESLVIAGISNDSSLVNTEAQVGDLIIGVNGKPMNSSDTLLDLISTGNVGDTLTLNLCRVDNRTYQITEFDVTITLVEDRGETKEETTAAPSGGYNYGGAGSFEDFFNDYFGSFIR